jgi:hypothetical protein
VLAVAIKLFSLSSYNVEHYYSEGIYPWIAYTQRLLFGWIPFSVGDLLYTYAGLWLIFRLVGLIRTVRRKKVDRLYLKKTLFRTLNVALLIYILFNALWGLNYNRYGIDYQLKIESSDYNDSDLLNVTRALSERLNALQSYSLNTRAALRKKKTLFKGAVDSYSRLAAGNSIFKYKMPSIKPSIYSYLGNYLGFTGYYNPFTGESQVNTTVPEFIRPFTTCHEIGHALGYAKESEANFAGYLSAIQSTDSAFVYSVYFEMYAYSARYLYYSDSLALRRISENLSPGVKMDIRALRLFLQQYDTPIESAIDRLYSQYLMANEQPAGRMSYNEVVGMLIAYYKKNGHV